MVALSVFGVINYTESSFVLLQQVFGQRKASKPHTGYVRVPDQEPLKLSCDTCSVVSSSGQILGRLAGAEIDRASCVWRMNSAPTRGFEADVGHRTSLRVVSHTSVPLLVQRQHYFFGQANDTVYVVWGPLRNMRRDGRGVVYNMLRQVMESYPQARVYVTTEERMNHCDRVFKEETGKDRIQSGSYLSTGWFTLILAMDMCKEIHVYGMINDTYCRYGVSLSAICIKSLLSMGGLVNVPATWLNQLLLKKNNKSVPEAFAAGHGIHLILISCHTAECRDGQETGVIPPVAQSLFITHPTKHQHISTTYGGSVSVWWW
ncbi:alpha-N-acetylgalactosaminide alpha-2,6-sialyltransferase 3 isoform X2 [Paramormyrops kingsleyae]